MVVNLYADRMMTTSPQTAEEVWNATHVRSRLYTDAANRIGLTPSEYQQFRDALLDGKAIFVRLPRHLDAMAGSHHGQAYAVHNVVLTTSNVAGWEVSLANGAHIYVPQICGNLSLLRQPVKVARRPPVKHVAHVPHATRVAAAKVVPTPPPPTQVSLEAPSPAPIPVSAAAVAAPANHAPWYLLLLPIATLFGGGGGPSAPPPCTQGSNSSNVCQSTTSK